MPQASTRRQSTSFFRRRSKRLPTSAGGHEANTQHIGRQFRFAAAQYIPSPAPFAGTLDMLNAGPRRRMLPRPPDRPGSSRPGLNAGYDLAEREFGLRRSETPC
jgi:hypothetical protein